MDADVVIPLTIIALFLVGIVGIGRLAGKRATDADQYLVAGRGASFYLTVATLFATFWGGGTVIGGSGAAYADGIIGIIEDPFAAGLSLILIGLFFVKILRRSRIRSLGEMYDRRYGHGVSYLASGLMIPTYALWTAVQLLAIGKIMSTIFDLNFYVTFFIGTAVVVLFTYMGGMLAVMWTDAVQVVIIFIGLVVIIVAGISFVGGIDVAIDAAPDDFWNILPREATPVALLTYIAMWAGMALGNIPSPDIAQRAFIAKSEGTAKRGMITAGLMYWTIGFVPLILALIGIAMVGAGALPGDALANDGELVVPYLAEALLNPVGLGIFVASLIAAILSSASTSLFATAVLCANDLYRPLWLAKRNAKEEIERRLHRATKYSVVIIGVLAAMVGLAANSLYDLTVFAFTFQFGTLFWPFVLALKTDWANRYGVIAGMLGGAGVIVLGSVTQQAIIPEPWWFFTLVPQFVNLLLIVVVSFATRNSKNINRRGKEVFAA